MNVIRQIYYCGVSGALAGVLSWYIIGVLDAARWPNIWFSNAFVGAGIGGLLAVSLTLTRGVVERWAFSRLINNIGWITTAGVLAGLTGLFIGQIVFELARGEWLGRTAGWVALSVLVGLAQTVREPTPYRIGLGAVAGLVAGMISGLIYEAMTQAFLSQSATAQCWGSAAGLMTVGGAFAVGIPTIERIAAQAVVVVRSGPRSGSEFVLIDKLVAGASESCRLYLPGDPDMEPLQAEFYVANGVVSVRNLGKRQLYFGATVVPPNGEAVCPKGSEIKLGNTTLGVV